MKAKNFRDIDKYISIRIYGYPTVDDYYKSESIINRIQDIEVPSIFMFCSDDPVVQPKIIPKEKFL